MTKMSDRLFKSLVVLILAACSPFCDEQFERGVHIPSGDSAYGLAHNRGELYSMVGSERISRTELRDITLVHVIVLRSKLDVTGVGMQFENDCLVGREILSWHITPSVQRQLKIQYDGKNKTVQIGTEKFSAVQANCFLVRLDSSWRPRTTRLPVLVAERSSPETILNRIRDAARMDRDVQTLQTYDEAKKDRGLQ